MNAKTVAAETAERLKWRIVEFPLTTLQTERSYTLPPDGGMKARSLRRSSRVTRTSASHVVEYAFRQTLFYSYRSVHPLGAGGLRGE